MLGLAWAQWSARLRVCASVRLHGAAQASVFHMGIAPSRPSGATHFFSLSRIWMESTLRRALRSSSAETKSLLWRNFSRSPTSQSISASMGDRPVAWQLWTKSTASWHSGVGFEGVAATGAGSAMSVCWGATSACTGATPGATPGAITGATPGATAGATPADACCSNCRVRAALAGSWAAASAAWITWFWRLAVLPCTVAGAATAAGPSVRVGTAPACGTATAWVAAVPLCWLPPRVGMLPWRPALERQTFSRSLISTPTALSSLRIMSLVT
mmetsp:Transcript_108374/g.324084  ORF Transcript_108374/g.324084 Transcript_108374/m.324084 type:complete len:272 (+) Transcript_108374:121-936(+)